MDFFRFVYYSFEGKNPRCRPWSILRHLRPSPPPLPRLRRNHYLAVRQFLRINSQKRPVSEAGTINPSNPSMNSLRSDSFSCRFACFAYATQESKKIPKIVHPLKTSSCGMFSRIHPKKHEARSAVTSSARLACPRMFLNSPTGRAMFFKL